MNKRIKGVVILSALVFIVLFIQLIIQYPPCQTISVDFKKLADFGTSVGGIFTFLSVYLLYKTLTNQRKASKQQSRAFNSTQFENRIFELLRYHRDNVSVTEMRNPNDYDERYFKGHKAFRDIYRQFEELLGYVTSFLKDQKLEVIYSDISKFEEELQILNSKGVEERYHKKLNEINIAYLILFYGVDRSGRKDLEDRLSKKYNKQLLELLLDNLAERPALWSLKIEEIVKEVKEEVKSENSVFKISKRKENTWTSIEGRTGDITENIKFYGGHQYRLGHYFRHLFHTITYIDNKGIDYENKYEYTMLVRAQLSSYEQRLLFVNSISDLGRAWELKTEAPYDNSTNINLEIYYANKALITKYDLIRNVSDDLGFIKISNVYPNLTFDGNLVSEERKELNKVFHLGYK